MSQTKTTNAQINPITDIKIPNAPQAPKVGGGNELLDVNFILRETIAIQPGQIVADLGAGGAAYFTIQAAKIVGSQGEVYAVDVVKNTLSSIEGKARMAGLYNIKTVWSNLEILGATKIPAETLDHALLINILFQTQKKADILAEAIRLLKPGGRLTIVDWNDTKPSFSPSAEMQVDQNELINIAKKLNLQLEQEFKAGNYHFGLIFIK